MNISTLELTLCQLIKVAEASRKNHHAYSDQKKGSFHTEIEELVQLISKADFSKWKDSDMVVHRRLFNILFAWLEFLDNSTLNNIPFEIVYCLQSVLKDWLDSTNYEKYVIVTSLDTHSSFFYYDLELGSLTKYVKDTYGKDISNTLVPINLPKYLVHDYLANVTLYHEVGHFVDSHYKISERIVDSDPLYSVIAKDKVARQRQINHFSEFFADLFAAQYIGDKGSIYLNHIGHALPESWSHPATARRLDVVDAFLTGRSDIIIDKIINATKKLTGRDLKPKRYEVITKNHFEEYLPAEIERESQLHYLFIQGWESWFDNAGVIRSRFDARDSYRIINNLIEKSISNFAVLEKWKQNVSNKK